MTSSKRRWMRALIFIDTANVYSFGQSEQLLGQSLIELGIPRDQVVIATKVLGRMDPRPNSTGLSRYHIFNSVDASLKRLQMDYIDVLYVHGVDPATSIEQIVHSLNDIVNSGKVRYIAICNWPAWMVATLRRLPNGTAGSRLSVSSIITQPFLGILSMNWCRWLNTTSWLSSRGVRWPVVFCQVSSPAKGLPPVRVVSRLISRRSIRKKRMTWSTYSTGLASAHGVTVAQVALAWVRQQPGVTSTIIGAKSTAQLTDNLQSVNVQLTTGDLKKIDEVSPLPKQYPGWMVERQSAYRN